MMIILNDITNIIMGQSPESSSYNEDGKGLPFYQGKAEFGANYPITVKWCSRPGKIAEKGDVLISVRAPVGPTNICQERICIGRGLAAVRPLGGMQTQYLRYWLSTKQQELEAKSTGTTFKAILGETLRSLKMNLFSLPEQKRILAKIESLFSRLDSAKDSFVRVRAEIKRYRQSVLKWAFEGKLTDIHLKDSKLGTLVEINIRNHIKDKVNVGFLPMRLIEANYSGKHAFEFRKWSEVKSGLTHVKEGDVLLAKITPCFENGKSAVVEGVPNGYGAATTEVFAISVDQTVLLSKYLYFFLRQEKFILEGKKFMTGAVGQKRVPRKYVELLNLPIGSLNEQKEIVEAIESRFERTRVLENTVNQGLGQIDRLKQSILKKAFKGKLVESNPNDEPVEVLLERIKKEKTKLNKI